MVELGKHIPVKEADGEFAGMSYFSPKASRYFFEELQSHFEHHGLHGYMMDILIKISQKHKIPISYTLCEESSRIEIDSVHDLIVARRLAASSKKGS